MSLVYFVSTGNYLHKSKKFFECFCEAIDHIKNIITMGDKELDMEDINISYQILRIDNKKMPDYGMIYKEMDISSPARKKGDDKIIE